MSPAGALSRAGFDGLWRQPNRRDYVITVGGADVFDGFLIANYSVSPIPDVLLRQSRLLEGEKAGIAIDSAQRTYRRCRSGYRTSRTGTDHLVGVLRIGPDQWCGLGEVTILFAPFAHTVGLRRILCELRVAIDDAGAVEVISLQGPEGI